ncbi:MAG: hypothetical protein NDI62_00530 [Burkholderiales bacterium]|nr:hypothetical protein [Burkholderiales bacterium]
MKKGIILFLLIIFLVFASTSTAFAYSSFGRMFAGKITNTKATEIAQWEAAGYICPMFGTSISIIPIGSPHGTPVNYFIPSYISSATRTNPSLSKLIIGRYSGQTMITCTLYSDPPQTQTVSLNTINLFGTSR